MNLRMLLIVSQGADTLAQSHDGRVDVTCLS